jgi:hypothetical protein
MPHIGTSTVDTAAVAEKLRAITSASTLPDVRSATSSNDRQNVQKVYEAIQYAPAWVREGQPTPQALANISALENSQQKGLIPENYEASRWPARLVALKVSNTG